MEENKGSEENICTERLLRKRKLQISEENINLEPDDTEFVRKFQSDTTEMTKQMFNNSLCSDVKIFANHKVIRGHKFILMRNPLFSKMIASNPDLKEIYFFDQISKLVESDNRHLFGDDFNDKKEDVSLHPSEACETFLRYLYGTEINKELINLDLMLVAYNYSDEMLKDFCQNHLIKVVNVRNAVQTLLVSLETQSEKLKIEACKIIARNFNEMKFNQDLNPILENDDALSEILNVFDDCNTTLLKLKVEDENLRDSLNQLRSSDLLMTVGNYHFLTHKKILSERNAVFKAMIDATSSDGFPTSVNIPDVDHKSFKIFLHYIYTDEEMKDDDVLENLLKLAHTYTDDKLKDICEKTYLQKLGYDNVIELLLVAIKFDCKYLQKCASNYIVVRYDIISSQDDYQKLLHNPDAINVLIRTLYERQKTNKNNAFFNGRFILKLPIVDTNVVSEQFTVKNMKLWIDVEKKSSNGGFFLDIYLYVNRPEPNVCLCYSFNLISAIDKKHDIMGKIAHVFKKSGHGWGWSEFISWSTLENPEYGYIKNGKITLEVDVTAV